MHKIQSQTITVWLILLICLLAGCSQPVSKPQKSIMINWSKLPDLPGMADTASLGVSAPFAGISNGKLLVAGGCNFPDKPVTEGGEKKYYSDIFMLDLKADQAIWKKVGNLPFPVAYGASVTTPYGVVCIGGNNSTLYSKEVFRLTWNDSTETVIIDQYEPLPHPMDNFAAAYADSTIYVAGGNRSNAPYNTFLSMSLNEANWTSLPNFPGSVRIQPVLTALKTPQGTRVYLTGGFQPAYNHKDAIIPTDMLVYHPETKTWEKETEVPFFEDGRSPRTFTGGCAVAYTDSSILLMGGVNYKRFFNAINRQIHMEKAEKRYEFEALERLSKESKEYMHHPVEWYQFNTALLQYNIFTKEWKDLGNYEQLARAGAGAVMHGNSLIIVNGELKPGIRTPQVNCALIKE